MKRLADRSDLRWVLFLDKRYSFILKQNIEITAIWLKSNNFWLYTMHCLKAVVIKNLAALKLTWIIIEFPPALAGVCKLNLLWALAKIWNPTILQNLIILLFHIHFFIHPKTNMSQWACRSVNHHTFLRLIQADNGLCHPPLHHQAKKPLTTLNNETYTE